MNNVEKEINEENKKTKNHYLGHKFVNKYNEDEQKAADETATDKRRNALNYFKANYEIKGKDKSKKYLKIVAELKHLETHNIRGKYKPIDYSDIHTIEKKGKKVGSQTKKTLNYDPKNENIFSTTTNIFLKGATMGGAGSLPFLWKQSWRVVLLFYLTFILSLLSTILTTYIKTRRKTSKNYLPAREFKLDLKRDMNKFIYEEEKIEQERKKALEQETIKTKDETDKTKYKEVAKNAVVNLPESTAEKHENQPVSETGDAKAVIEPISAANYQTAIRAE
jgi:hypothetical protein